LGYSRSISAGYAMSTITDISALQVPASAFPTSWTVADLQTHLGGIPAERILLYPPAGTATEEDALRLDDQEDRICELVDGVLVEKPMSSFESLVAMLLARILGSYIDSHDRGILLGEAGQLWILPTKMRIPDISFICWERFPDGKLPRDRVYRVAPDLAVEILSEGNTPQEMELKLDEYFEAGVRLVWYIDPRSRSARIFTARDQVKAIDESGQLEGGDVLPGFTLRLGELFERAERRQGE
jgi:Uma2 family endonuclease